MMMRSVVIIPARYASVRLPGKPLINLAGKPMIQWVYERAQQIPSVDDVIVATDDQRIADAVTGFGGSAVMTPQDIRNGSERVGYVAKDLDAEIVINLQGDEPLISPEAVGAAIEALRDDRDIHIATLGCAISEEDEWQDPSVVKVLTDEQGNAIYFSRAQIPCFRDEPFTPLPGVMRHIGVYVYRNAFLQQFLSWPEGTLEAKEKLEQLRILEKGHLVRVIETTDVSPGVDVPDDILRIETLIKERGLLREFK